MDTEVRRSGVDFRVVTVAAIVLLLALGGAAAWAYATNTDLERTRQALAATTGDLDGTKASLTETQGNVATASADVAAEQKAIKDDMARLTTLELRISRKASCIAMQTANLAEIRRILAIQRTNFDLTTSGSTWYKAHAASDKALDLAISYMAKAYTSAAAGSYNTANSWLDKSNAQVRASNRQLPIEKKETDKFNAAVDEINKASDAFAETLAKTSATCGG